MYLQVYVSLLHGCHPFGQGWLSLLLRHSGTHKCHLMTEQSSYHIACRGLIEEQLDMELRTQRLASFGDWLTTRQLCSLAEQNLGLRLSSTALDAELSLPPGVWQLARPNLLLPMSPAVEATQLGSRRLHGLCFTTALHVLSE